MRVGEYQHPLHGKISFTSDRLMRFADSVRNKVRGIALDIDYDHKADPTKGNEAAGWVEDAKVEGDTLYLLVDWTKSAVSKIKEKAYRYFSPEFQDEWTDAQGVIHRDVLFGGGITNRPFLKDLLPVNLSELTFAEQKKGTGMDLAQLRKLYGLAADGSQDDQILTRAEQDRAAATDKTGQPADRTATTHAPNNGATSNPGGTIDGKPFDATTATAVNDKGEMITPEDIQLSELAKTNPAVRVLLAERAANNKRLADLEQSNLIATVSVKLNEYRTGAQVVAPAILDEAAKLLYKLPVKLHEDVHNLIKCIQGLGGNATVQLGETGHAGNSTNRVNGKTAVELAEEKIAATRKQFTEATGKEMSYADAISDVMAANPELFKQYQDESYAFRI